MREEEGGGERRRREQGAELLAEMVEAFARSWCFHEYDMHVAEITWHCKPLRGVSWQIHDI